MAKIRYQGVGERGIPLTMKEIVLIHMENLSTEIMVDGLKKEYEPALDRLMNWLYWEFTVDHRETEIDWPTPEKDGSWQYAKVLIGAKFFEVMGRRFGDPSLSDKDRSLRIQDKERLLALLLAEHRISLGKDTPYEIEQGEQDLSGLLMQEGQELDGKRPNAEDL